MENSKIIDKAVSILNSGGIIIYPTDTVFGIGCLANKPEAIKKLFKIRKRPENNAVTLLVDSVNQATEYFKTVTPQLTTLMKKYWPGALTIVYYCNKERVNKLIRANGDTVGIRMPNHRTALEIIKRIEVPLLGPSANFHKGKTPFNLKDIDKELIKLVDYVVPGSCFEKKASTVVDCTKTPFQILRKGAINFYTLFIDTTGYNKTLVSISDGEHVFKKESDDKAQVTLSLINNLLEENKLKLMDIALIKVSTGPGSFVGIRIGQTIARTLGFLLNIAVLGIIFLFFLTQTTTVLAINLGENIKNIVNQSVKSTSSTYSDSSYTASSNRFTLGSPIYIRIVTQSKGTQKRTIQILDSNKNKIQEVVPQIKADGDTLVYTGITTINNPGTYYLDVKIEDGSNSFSLQQNIEITGNKEPEVSVGTIIPTVPEENKFVASPSSTGQLNSIQENSLYQQIISFVNKIVDVILNKVKDL